MVTRFIKSNIALLCLAALAISLVVARACLQSVTIDEAHSCLGFARGSWLGLWYPGYPNHLLNSLLERPITTVFGLNELTPGRPRRRPLYRLRDVLL
jgi:hypothetical protein